MEPQSAKRKSRQPPAVLPATRALGSPNSAALAQGARSRAMNAIHVYTIFLPASDIRQPANRHSATLSFIPSVLYSGLVHKLLTGPLGLCFTTAATPAESGDNVHHHCCRCFTTVVIARTIQQPRLYFYLQGYCSLSLARSREWCGCWAWAAEEHVGPEAR